MSSGNRVLVDLTPDQLKQLAVAVHAQELEKLQTIHFKSYTEQLEYLNSCRQTNDIINQVLQQVQTMNNDMDQSGDETKKNIAHNVYDYALKAVNVSLQLIQSYDARKKELQKLSTHCDNLISRLRVLDPATQTKEAQDLALEALTYRKAIIDHASKLEKFLPNKFSDWIKSQRLTFEQLLTIYKEKVNPNTPFKDLSDIEKLEVYENIVAAAGKGGTVVTYTKAALGTVGAAVLVFTAGAMVWDIFTSEDKIETSVQDISNLALTQLDLAAVAGEAIEAGLEAAGVEVAEAAISVAGTIIGWGVGALIGVAVGALIDLIFSSGTTKVVTTQGLIHCYVSPMPNGVQLANIIKANNPPK